ncbi:MAG: ATP-binding protein [Pseudanabaenaceae cyanobacterium SKYGB_i_bin29]|nr:ATP-binding protein [Pseudanabaenaceae cyanobacterium SKYG29]MDW8421812.1 ATP-binding protein [Pseudanabaenaceae cyanobacterium SKYGB_i_bin29]
MNKPAILIVEDEAVVAMDIENTICRLGYTLFGSVTTAEEALCLVEQNKPNLVLCDIRLAGEMDGVTLSEVLRQKYSIPVVFLTAHADVVTIERASQTKPFGYVVKPFQEKDLHVAIEIALARYEAESNLALALRKEEELRQVKTRFFATAIHDIRSPLTQIAFAAHILESTFANVQHPHKQRYFDRIHKGVENIRQLLDDVLQIQRLESERLALNPMPTELVKLCRQLRDEVQTCAGDRYNISFNVNIDREVVVLVDQMLLQRMLGNLLSNAVKYSPGGGTVFFSLDITAKSVTFTIRDNGIGIPAASLEHIFEAFQRGTNVADIPGTGLGLAIVKMCVDACGGEITIDSTVNVGTTVRVSLPLVECASFLPAV